MPKSEANDNKSHVRVQVEPNQKSKTPVNSADAAALVAPERAGLLDPLLTGSDFSESTFQRHADLLGSAKMSHSMHAGERAGIVMQLQRDYGNRYVQRPASFGRYGSICEE